MKRRFLKTAAAAVAAVLFCTGAAQAADFDGTLSAQSAILVDAQSGRVLFEKNADERRLLASTTKIMTGLLVCETEDLAREISVPAQAAGVEGSSLYLKAGERVTIETLLYGLLLRSGNDAAVALAIAADGSVEAFCARMNARAQELGMRNTHFENPNGLDGDGQFSTARDLSKLACAAMENETFRTVVSSKSFSSGARSFTNHNKLLWRVEGCDGVKTGYTKKAGRILVGSAVRNGRRLVCVTMNDPDDWRDQSALFDYGFSAFTLQRIVSSGEAVGSAAVVGSETTRVRLLAGADASYPLAEGETIETRLHAPDFVYAPLVPGQAGWLEVLVDGNCAGEVPVYYEEGAEAKTPKRGLWKRFFGG